MGGNLSQSLPKPLPKDSGPPLMALSDDFLQPAFGTRWRVYRPASDASSRARIEAGALVIPGVGQGPQNCSPIVGGAGDHAYEISVDVELDGDIETGLLLFFDERLFLGMGHDGHTMTTYAGGRVSFWREPAPPARHLRMRIVNDGQIVTFFYSAATGPWTQHGLRFEVSAYNANVVDDLGSLRPALFAARGGAARFRSFRYRALAE